MDKKERAMVGIWRRGGAAAMACVVAGTWQGVHYTSTTEFCLSCHAMRAVGEEYRSSTHFRNASGVRAECEDCHIPPALCRHWRVKLKR